MEERVVLLQEGDSPLFSLTTVHKIQCETSRWFPGSWTRSQVTNHADVNSLLQRKQTKKETIYMSYSKSIHSRHNHLYLHNKQYFKQPLQNYSGSH